VEKKLSSAANSKGASLFQKMLNDKKSIREHIQKGGKISDLKDKFSFVKPISGPLSASGK
jgi:hypothetical protein